MTTYSLLYCPCHHRSWQGNGTNSLQSCPWCEIERLRAALDSANARRIHWQDLAYAGMRVIDAVAGNRLRYGEGVTEDTCLVAAQMAIDKVAYLKEKAAREAGGGE